MINTDIKTNIPFGGFYNSYHGSNIDKMIEAYEYDWENVNYTDTHNSYIDDYASKLSSFILSEYKIEIDFKNIKLNSPTKSYDGYMSFYNYNQALANKDDILIFYVLEYVSNEFNEKYAFYGDIEFEVSLLADNIDSL